MSAMACGFLCHHRFPKADEFPIIRTSIRLILSPKTKENFKRNHNKPKLRLTPCAACRMLSVL